MKNFRLLLLIFISVVTPFSWGMNLRKQQENKITKLNNQIIILNGTTTAGKSSATCELKRQLEARSLSVEVFTIDDIFVPKIQWLLAQKRFNPFNVFVANGDLITPEDIEMVGKISQAELCTKAKNAYKLGKIVIIDAPIYRSDQIDFYHGEFAELPKLAVTWALVYCPLSTLVDRIIKRNTESGWLEQRSLLQALDQFHHLYVGNAADSIDQLQQKDLDDICNRVYEQHNIMQNRIPDFLKGIQSAICPLDFKTLQKLMIAKFAWRNNFPASIGSIGKHDCVVNAVLYNPAVCAGMIIDALCEKTQD
jgi:chloramphenicol 3-O-phosphotransferase